jgi:hypothetical protein
MKRLILIALFLCVAVSAQASKVITPSPTGHGTFLEIGGPLTHDNVYNVKDFGAKGDGITGDNLSIIAAFDFAVARWTADNNAKTTIYFPAGDYALLKPGTTDTPGGIQYVCPDGFGGLTILGDGGNASRLLWTGTETIVASIVYAFEFKPTTYPTTLDSQRLHDMSIIDFGVYDNDPDTHENPGGEETHGFIMRAVDRVLYDGVVVDSCGDEYIIVKECHDVLITRCVTKNDLYSDAGSVANAGINIMEGCDNVVVSGCRLFSSENSKNGGVGISIEMQEVGLGGAKNITITGNVIQNCTIGIWFFNGFGQIENVTVSGNSISECEVGIGKSSEALYNFKNISISGNVISSVHCAIEIIPAAASLSYLSNISILSNTIKDVNYDTPSRAGFPGVGMVVSGTNVNLTGNLIENCDWSGILLYTFNGVNINSGSISNVNQTDSTYAAIDVHSSPDLSVGAIVDGVSFIDVIRQAIGSGIDSVKNCNIRVTEDVTVGKVSMSGIPVCINNTMNYPAGGIPSDCQYIGNRFINSGNPGTHWLTLTNVADGIFKDNYFEATGSTSRAIWSRLTTTNCTITGNNATNHGTTAPFYFQSAAGGNVIFDNNQGVHTKYQVELIATDPIPPISVIQVKGSGGAVTCTAEPSIAVGAFIGQEMTILGEDNTNHWTLKTGTLYGTNLGADRQLDVGSVLVLKWDGALWQEVLYSA